MDFNALWSRASAAASEVATAAQEQASRAAAAAQEQAELFQGSETYATLEKALPYLFVHEADEKKGGAPLATLKLELQDEAQREQLFDDRRVTQWHRKSEFQMISLIEIAEDMLKHSPKYQGQAGFSLYMPGSVHERKLTFRTPVLLYASSNNPGAEAAASELLEQFKDFHVTSEPPKLASSPTRTTDSTDSCDALGGRAFALLQLWPCRAALRPSPRHWSRRR